MLLAGAAGLVSPVAALGPALVGGDALHGNGSATSQAAAGRHAHALTRATLREQDLQQQVAELGALLAQSEKAQQALRLKEAALTEALCDERRVEKRQNLNIEYLKNVFIKFFEGPASGSTASAGAAPAAAAASTSLLTPASAPDVAQHRLRLLKVMAQVLHLSPDEMVRIQHSISTELGGNGRGGEGIFKTMFGLTGSPGTLAPL
ncbi:hypothetical protein CAUPRSCDRAFT_11075 [Caulochytrium protostelioides]|uniref:GRIP domain-containing protein n=1 Tax=Caulochytrium protostelioides TaxID=1555241 RepID=A0A4V1ITJ2_9FUNG|nr:hypothetical protein CAUPRSCDRAFT_11075 [Caulochytrium protostelioides]